MQIIFTNGCKGKKKLIKPMYAKRQADLEKVVSEYDILFQEPKGLPPKKKIEHDINLQQDAPFPNIGM